MSRSDLKGIGEKNLNILGIRFEATFLSQKTTSIIEANRSGTEEHRKRIAWMNIPFEF